jgi:hypothetical protein
MFQACESYAWTSPWWIGPPVGIQEQPFRVIPIIEVKQT